MKFSNKEIDYVTRLIQHHMVSFTLFKDGVTDRNVKRYVVRLGEDLLDDMIVLNYCDRSANLSNTNHCSYEEYLEKHTIKQKWLEIKEKDNCFKVTDLKINGHDVMKLGIKGKEVGEVLNKLFDEVESKLIVNEREILLKRLNIYSKI